MCGHEQLDQRATDSHDTRVVPDSHEARVVPDSLAPLQILEPVDAHHDTGGERRHQAARLRGREPLPVRDA